MSNSNLIALKTENELLRKKLAIALRAFDKIVDHLDGINTATKYMKDARNEVQALNKMSKN